MKFSLLCSISMLLVMLSTPRCHRAVDEELAPGSPFLGTHALVFHLSGDSSGPIATPAMNTQSSGSTILACLGRGDISGFASLPTDNRGNAPYLQLGSPHAYTNWGSSSTALYAFPLAVGGSGHVVSAAAPPGDEVTLAVVEIINGGVIQDYAWNEVLAGHPITSSNVATTGPAVLVAFWWGDAYAMEMQTATPNNGFQVIEAHLIPGNTVQCAVAAKTASAAGTYNVTWTSTPRQGAQLWLVAVQKRS